jgi:hypothetical protein
LRPALTLFQDIAVVNRQNVAGENAETDSFSGNTCTRRSGSPWFVYLFAMLSDTGQPTKGTSGPYKRAATILAHI